MPEIKEQKNFYWLFADTIKSIYEFTDYIPEFITSKDKKVSVFVLTGEDTDGRVGDFLLTTWNVTNINAIRKQLGTNTDAWKNHLFSFKKKGERMLEMVVEK